MHLSRLHYSLVLGLVMFLEAGCAQDSRRQPAPDATLPAAAQFRLKVVHGVTNPGAQLFDCTYQARGKIARFRIRYIPERHVTNNFPVAALRGAFLAVGGSDNSALLEDLKVVLEARNAPRKRGRVAQLPFDGVVMGENQSRTAAATYLDRPRGDWVITKLYLPKGSDKGEIFFGFNLVRGIGEFSEKDSAYGDYLINQLVRVL